VPLTSTPKLLPEPEKPVKPKRERAPKDQVHPSFLLKARELRDRWMEQMNSGVALIESSGKYDVVRQRQLTATAREVPLLPAA
jgi:hypothetical protein